MASRFEEAKSLGSVQQFTSGATRSADDGKFDFEGFLSPSALEAFGAYMNKHRLQPDGSMRESDNWQKGIPITSYVKSLVRHTLELWGLHRGHVSKRLLREQPGASIDDLKVDVACAIWFNTQGFIHEMLKQSLLNPSEDYLKKLQELKPKMLYDRDRDNPFPGAIPMKSLG